MIVTFIITLETLILDVAMWPCTIWTHNVVDDQTFTEFTRVTNAKY